MAFPGYSKAKKTIQVVDFKGQNYEELKRKHLQEKSLFIDPKFPATADSLQIEEQEHLNPEWRRPKVNEDDFLFELRVMVTRAKGNFQEKQVMQVSKQECGN